MCDRQDAGQIAVYVDHQFAIDQRQHDFADESPEPFGRVRSISLHSTIEILVDTRIVDEETYHLFHCDTIPLSSLRNVQGIISTEAFKAFMRIHQVTVGRLQAAPATAPEFFDGLAI